MNLASRMRSKVFLMALGAYLFTASGQFGLDLPNYVDVIFYALLNTLVVLGILTDTGTGGIDLTVKGLLDSLRHPTSLMSIGALILLVGQSTGLYSVPENFQAGFKTILDALVFLGILNNPQTKGLND